MNEQELWDKFTADGKIADYLEYRKHLDMLGKMELKMCDENKCIGTGCEGTECR